MSLAAAYRENEDPVTALARLPVDTEEQAADALAEVLELVVTMNTEIAFSGFAGVLNRSEAGEKMALLGDPPPAQAIPGFAVGLPASGSGKLKTWLSKLQPVVKQIAKVLGAASYTIAVSGPVPPTVSVSITFTP